MASSKTVTVGRVEALAASGPRMQALEGRVGAVEGSVEELLTLRERVAAMEEEIAALKAAPVGRAKGKAAGGGGGGKKERVKKEVAPLPESAEGAPEASAYRIPEGEIQEGVCVGRVFNETDASKDRRWSPAVYRELQCGGDLVEGEELCATCLRRQAKYAEEPKSGPWLGRIDEEPLEWCHMLGTEWAETRKPRWKGEGAGDSASEASSVSAGGAKPGRKPAKSEEEKEAEKAAKAAAKEAEKAAKAAAKEAEKAAKAAEKEAEKAAKAAAKEAEKAAKAAEKEAEKAAKKPSAPKKPSAAPAPAAAAAAAPAVAAYTIKLIDGEFYAISGSDVFEYDSMEEKRGALVGHMEGDVYVPLAEKEEAEEEADDADAE